jgi:hypothetical protein
MPPELLAPLAQLGLAGVVIFSLGFAVLKLYNRTIELQDTLADLGKESVKANEQITNALNQMAEVNRATVSTVQQLNGSVQQLVWANGFKQHKQGAE